MLRNVQEFDLARERGCIKRICSFISNLMAKAFCFISSLAADIFVSNWLRVSSIGGEPFSRSLSSFRFRFANSKRVTQRLRKRAVPGHCCRTYSDLLAQPLPIITGRRTLRNMAADEMNFKHLEQQHSRSNQTMQVFRRHRIDTHRLRRFDAVEDTFAKQPD